MARRSLLVYELLRTGQPEEGFTEKEIVEQISTKHDIMMSKALRKQVALALRRGLDFSILTKKRNKFKFDPDCAATTSRKTKKSPQGKRTRRAPSRKKREKTPARLRNSRKPTPQPNFPMPPGWTSKRRKLTEEPVSRVKKV